MENEIKRTPTPWKFYKDRERFYIDTDSEQGKKPFSAIASLSLNQPEETSHGS